MRYAQTVEICNVCKKKFYGMPINVHGSYEYIHHTNFSNSNASSNCSLKSSGYKSINTSKNAYRILIQWQY